jgi:hypothetical protein
VYCFTSSLITFVTTMVRRTLMAMGEEKEYLSIYWVKLQFALAKASATITKKKKKKKKKTTFHKKKT